MADEIKCPACGYVFEDEERSRHITYWGEDSVKDDECPACEAELLVAEHVTREFEVSLANDAEDEGTEKNRRQEPDGGTTQARNSG